MTFSGHSPFITPELWSDILNKARDVIFWHLRALRLFTSFALLILFLNPAFSEDTPFTYVIYGELQQNLVNPEESPLTSPLGLVYNPSQDKIGTAFLVADCFVLTALHVVNIDGNTDLYFGRSKKSQTRIDQFDPGNYKYHVIAKVERKGKISNTADAQKYTTESVRNDWALLRISPCLKTPETGLSHARVLPFSSNKMLKSYFAGNATLAGYPVDERPDGTVWIQSSCNIFGPTDDIGWRTDCQARPGLSGAPLWAKYPGRPDYFVVGITSRALGRPLKMHSSDSFLHYPRGHLTYYDYLPVVLPISYIYNEIRDVIPSPWLVAENDVEDENLRIDSLKQKIVSSPSSADLWTRLGLLKGRGNDANGAIDAFNAALMIDPNYAPARHNLAAYLITRNRGNDLQEALRINSELEKQFPDEPFIYIFNGYIFAMQDKCWELNRELSRLQEILISSAMIEISSGIKSRGCNS